MSEPTRPARPRVALLCARIVEAGCPAPSLSGAAVLTGDVPVRTRVDVWTPPKGRGGRQERDRSYPHRAIASWRWRAGTVAERPFHAGAGLPAWAGVTPGPRIGTRSSSLSLFVQAAPPAPARINTLRALNAVRAARSYRSTIRPRARRGACTRGITREVGGAASSRHEPAVRAKLSRARLRPGASCVLGCRPGASSVRWARSVEVLRPQAGSSRPPGQERALHPRRDRSAFRGTTFRVEQRGDE